MESSSQQQYKDEPTFDALSESAGLMDAKSTKWTRRPCPKVFRTVGVVCVAIALAAFVFTLGYTSGYHASPLPSKPTVDDASSVEHYAHESHDSHESNEVHNNGGHDHGYNGNEGEGEENEHHHGHSHDEGEHEGEGDEHHHSHDDHCETPYYRREWRSLSKDEKKGYMDAVQCMIDAPSVLGHNGSLVDDFAWAHNRVANGSKCLLLFEWRTMLMNIRA